MTGSLLSLAANKSGEIDVYMIGNPNITFFKNVYKRYTNFSKEIIKIFFAETDTKLGQTYNCKIPRKGSLLSKLYLYVELPDLVTTNSNESWKGYVNGVGFSLIKLITIKIGGMIIDRIDGNLLDIYNEIYNQESDSLVGKFNSDITLENNSNKQRLYIPLNFWFTKNEGLSLPLDALQFHEIEISVEFRKLTELVKCNITNITLTNNSIVTNLIGTFIHLDDNEKKYFIEKSHSYLIEQTQILPDFDINVSMNNIKIPLDFQHPVKEIFWVVCDELNHNENIKTGNNWLTYTSISSNNSDTFLSGKIILNGNDLLEYMNSDYYRKIVSYENYNNLPRKHIYTYCFSLSPLNHMQPSGSCNFSKFSRSFLDLNFNSVFNTGGICNGNIKVYGVNYNIFKIEKGMGGLLFNM